VKVSIARMRLEGRRGGGIVCGRRTALPFVVEHLVDHACDLVDPRLVEMRRQQRGEIFFDALAADFMNGFSARTNEYLLKLFLPLSW